MSVSIHNHDMFSLLDGFGTPREMLDKAREIGLKGYATTNHGNQYSWVYYDEIKKEYPEIKMIYGVEFYEAFDRNKKDKNNKYFHLIVLARNEAGRKAINKLVTISTEFGFYGKPRVDLNDLKLYANDLIISSACLGSKIAKADSYEDMLKYAKEYKDIFPYFYLEMQAHKNIDQIEYNKKILSLSEALDIPYIITTDSHRASYDEKDCQFLMTKIGNDKDTFGEIYDDCYMKTDEEIFEAMEYFDKSIIQKGLDNSDGILEFVDCIDMPFQDPKLPHFELPKEFSTENDYMLSLCKKGWIDRGYDKLSIEESSIRKIRMDYEFEVISKMGFSGYFLIVWDFVEFAKSEDIAVGAGRGSGAGSIIAYLLGITDIDPVTHKLIFERFLNPERVSFPDFDIDLGDREVVIKYLEGKYGKNSVCQVSNFSYITPKVAMNDTAKVMRDDENNEFNLNQRQVKAISNLFMESNFEECIESTSKLKAYQEKYPEWFDMASKISGRVRHSSIHACAIGIVNTEVNDYMGMTVSDIGERIIQVDKIKLEEIGIVKMDLLGITTLKVIQETLKLIGTTKELINPNKKEFLENEKMFQLLRDADTVGIFQVESYGMQELLRGLQPTVIGDISAVLALYRPDTMNMIEDYIERKHGRRETEYLHPDMESILGEDYACLIYQEQLMEIVRTFGGRSYGGADIFRKGIGKKNVKLVQAEAEKLYQEILDTGYGEIIARTISDDLAKKGKYSFNKSHSLGYAVLTLQTAYLKANYPKEFMTALLNSCLSQKDGKYKTNYKSLTKYTLDCKKRGIKIIPPKINKSFEGFSLLEEDIVFGLMLVKDIGQSIVPKIVSERVVNGKYLSFKDFCDRINPSKSEVVSLIKAGSFCKESDKMKLMKRYAKDSFEPNEFKPVTTSPTPKVLLECGIEVSNKEDNFKKKRIELYNEYKLELHKENQSKKYTKHINEFKNKYGKNKDFWEYDKLSIFLTHDPFEKYNCNIRRFDDVEIGERFVSIGIISKVDKKTGKNKAQFAFVDFYTNNKMVELICWHDTYKIYNEVITKDNKVVVLATKSEDDKIVLENIKPLNQWLAEKKNKTKKGLEIT